MKEKMCIKCNKDNQWFYSEYCFSCMRYENEKKLTEDIISGEVEETNCEDDIVCPWCGTRYDSFDVDENYAFMDESEHTTECGNCEKTFMYEASVSITFSTRRL